MWGLFERPHRPSGLLIEGVAHLVPALSTQTDSLVTAFNSIPQEFQWQVPHRIYGFL